MANSQAMCTSFMSELMYGYHQFGQPTLTSRGSLTAPTNDTFKAALYLTTATVNAATTVYSTTGEVSGTNYTAGGSTITNANTPTPSNTTATAGTAYWTPSASITYGTAGSPITLSTAFNAVLIYNSTQGNRAVSVHTFGSQTITAGVFTLTMPANTTTTALLRLSTT
jgi:hypothetical protein